MTWMKLRFFFHRSALLAAAVSFGCSSGDSSGAPQADAPDSSTDDVAAEVADAADVTDAPDAPTFDPTKPARCGLANYTWLPKSSVGAVLESKLALEMTAADVAAILKLLSSSFKENRTPKYDVQLHVVRYQTQNQGKLADATMMVAVPKLAAKETLPVSLHLHGTTGLQDACAPSKTASDSSQPYTVVALLRASLGYFTVLPDYLGMKSLGAASTNLHPYVIAEPTAQASLDAVRAAIAFGKDKAPNVTPGALFVDGASEGGFAAESVVRYARFYAPELPIKAAAFEVPATDIKGEIRAYIRESPPLPTSSLIAFYFAAVHEWYGGPALSTVYTPPGDTKVSDAIKAGTCPAHDPFPGTDLSTVFQPAALDAFGKDGAPLDPWSCYVRESSMITNSVPFDGSVPVLYVVAEKDKILHDEVERPAFTGLCGAGAKMQYLECAGAGHVQGSTWAFDDVLDFFDARVKDLPLAAPCTITAPTRCSGTP